MTHGPLTTLRPRHYRRRSLEKATQRKIKKILPIILTVTILATTAKARLGWSLEECMQHYGKPEYTSSDPFTDLPSYHFKTKSFEIIGLLNKAGRVVGITYFSHEMSEQDINNLLAGNAPKAEWQNALRRIMLFGKDLKMVPENTRHGLTRSMIQTPMPKCTAQCWKSKQWKLKNCGKVITSVGRKPFETCRRLPKIGFLKCSKDAFSVVSAIMPSDRTLNQASSFWPPL